MTIAFKLSILLVTYNHANYIKQALDSILRQQVDGPIEIIVADDGSSDNTIETVQSYDEIDARFHFKYLDHSLNLGITKNYQRGFASCSGVYVAVIEGDDYWCSPHKLQRQMDVLDTQWQCNLCSVNYYVYDESKGQFTRRTHITTGVRYVGAKDLIADNLVGNFSTCMYRKEALTSLPPALFDIKSYDWIVNICVARNSLIGFIEDPMSVYRLHSAGTWTKTSDIEKLRTQLDLIPAYDTLTLGTFKTDFEILTSRLRHVITERKGAKAVEKIIKPASFIVRLMVACCPPIVVSILKLMMPPVFNRFLKKLF